MRDARKNKTYFTAVRIVTGKANGVWNGIEDYISHRKRALRLEIKLQGDLQRT